MIRILAILTLVMSLFGVQFAHALDIGATAGARLTKSKVTGFTTKDTMSYQVGGLLVLPIAPMIGFRTGGLMVQRNIETKTPYVVKVDSVFLDVPLTLQVDLPLIRAYAGADLAMKMSSSCKVAGGTCTITDEKSTVFQPVVGVELSILPFIAVGAFYEPETAYSKDNKASAYGVTATFML